MNVVRNQDVKFTFHNQTGRFMPGGTVNGTFQFKFIFPKQVRCIYLEFAGQCETKYMKTGMRVKKSQGSDGKLALSAIDYIIQTRVFYVGNTNSESVEEIPAGVYTHDFEFILPEDIPPSFDLANNYGRICYWIKMVIMKRDRTMEETLQPFYVDTPPIDLRGLSHLFEPIELPILKKVKSFLCIAGMLNITVNVPRQAYKPKDKILVSIECENGTRFKIEKIEVTLSQIMTYHFNVPINDTYVKPVPLASKDTPAVPKYSTKGFEMELIVPASLKPYNLKNCKLIDLCYALHIKAVILHGMFHPQGEISIAIGDITKEEDLPQSVEFNNGPPSYSTVANQLQIPNAPIAEKY